jgi:hypothetical protein
VHQWKTKAKLAAMKEAAEAAKGKGKGGEQKQDDKKAAAAAAAAGKAPAGGDQPGIAPLPGEKVLVLDESLPDGALEEYFAELRSSRAQGNNGGGGGGGGAGEDGGKPKRRTIQVGVFGFWMFLVLVGGCIAKAQGGEAGT